MTETDVKCKDGRAVVRDLVSVIIPAYNAASLIEETLHSVFAQTHSEIETIVVDDGSTDSTAAIVDRYSPRVILMRQTNSGGCSSPRNHGLRVARGEFITFFDADDLMLPGKLARQVAFLRAHPQLGAVLMDYRNFDETGEAATSHFAGCPQLKRLLVGSGADQVLLDPLPATRILTNENYAIAGSPLVRRSLFDSVDPFDEDLRASEDFDLMYRIARHSGVGIIGEVGFLRRFHESNMSKRVAHVLRYKIESRSKLWRLEEDTENRRLLSREIASYHLSLAEFGHRSAPAQSLRHLWSALRFGHAPDLRLAKSLVKCAIGAVRPA